MTTGHATVLVEPNRVETREVDIADPEPGGALVRVVIGGARLQDEIPLAALVSHRFAIGDASKALEAVKSGTVIKAVIDPEL